MIPQTFALGPLTRLPRDDGTYSGQSGFDLEEAAHALGLPYKIESRGEISFRSADMPRLRQWVADRRKASVAQSTSDRPRKRKLSPYEQAKEKQRRQERHDAERRRQEEQERRPFDSNPPKQGKIMPKNTATVGVDEFVKANARDAGLAGALAMAAAANGENQAAAQTGTKARASKQTPRPSAAKQTAKDEFRALVEAKLDARLQAKKRFQPNARLSQGDTLRAQEEVHKEYPALRARMIEEANAGKLSYGMVRQ